MGGVNLERERRVAQAAVRAACRVCVAVREMTDPARLAKHDRSPVTLADFASQAVINWHLSQEFPDDPVVAEEDAAQLGQPEQDTLRAGVLEHARREVPITSEAHLLELIARGAHTGGPDGRFWTIDPIDGTKGFLRGEQYAVALALIDRGEVILGVLGCPNLPAAPPGGAGDRGCLLVARRGGGSVIVPLTGGEASSVQVSPTADPRDAVLCESVESGHTSHAAAAQVAAALGVEAQPVRMDSQCKYAAVARGDASVYLRLPTVAGYEEKIWDHAAGALIVEEAGGRVSDVAGRPLDFSLGRTLRGNRGVVATNDRLHESVLAALRTAGVT